MSGLQEFLAPFSHLLFANRNFVIVLLCAVAFWAAAQALLDRWRADRLERDLSSARSGAMMAPAGRRYAAGPAMEAAPPENTGALPPVKGGRTYARNLGSALQKAGMSAPQIYSPPTPAGYAPHTNPMQPPMGQPGPQAPYATPNVPWATPAGPPPTPWAFPGAAAAGRNAPAPAPFYQPQAGPPPSPMAPPSHPPMAPPNAGPPAGLQAPAGGFPTPQAGPFAVPPTAGPNAPAPTYPTYTPPAPGQMMGPAAPMPPMMAPAPQVDAGDARRGKPKRRRFNFNVLENLEKMVQSKAAEPPAAPAAPPVPPMAAPQAPITASLAGTATPPSAPPLSAPTPPVAPAAPPVAETPTLPFLFGKRDAGPVKTAEPVTQPSTPEPEAAATQPEMTEAAEEPEAPVASTPPAEVEEPVAPPEPKPEARRSMRSMMFGEEIASASAAGAETEAAEPAETTEAPVAESEEAAKDEQPVEETTDSGDTAWPSYRWTRSDQASSSTETSESAGETSTEESQEPEAAEPVSAFGSFPSWEPSISTEPEPAVETEASKPDSEPLAEVEEAATPSDEHAAVAEPAEASQAPEPPADAESNGSGAGTLVIIEDDQTAASYYATLFRGNGYRVEVANDGVSGVDLCTRVQPQVILLDVMMPRQNGILVLQTLRASDETKNTPVVVMSNFSEPTLIKRAIQLGALEYVIKTQVEGPALLNAMPRWINREKAFAVA